MYAELVFTWCFVLGECSEAAIQFRNRVSVCTAVEIISLRVVSGRHDRLEVLRIRANIVSFRFP